MRVRTLARYVPQTAAARALVPLAGLVAVILTVTAFTATALLIGAVPGGVTTEARASDRAKAEVPGEMLDLYRHGAETCPGLSWTVLAAVGRVESGHGQNVGPSSAGALGPMQFMPGTWGKYGVDASGDGRADIMEPSDAIVSAARMLCANGATQPGGLRGALWAYNHASWYVDLVIAISDQYALLDAQPAPRPEAASLLAAPGLVLTDRARGDLEAGRVDPRIMWILAQLTPTHTVSVSVFQTGHSPFVEGTTRYSNHLFGRAVDVYSVDGEAVSPRSPSARGLVEWLLALDGPNRPTEIGHPFPDLVAPGSFSDAAHQDHVHIGFDS